MVVMVSVSTCLVLTMAFVQTQSVSLQIRENVERRERALQAARSGAAAALRDMQQPGWGGADSVLSRVVESDGAGTASYEVRYARPATTEGPETALRLIVRATGRWVPADGSASGVERVVEVLVELRPRVPGRAVGTGDSAAASDLAANPPEYDAAQSHAVVATGTGTAVNLDPGDRIDGSIRLSGALRSYFDPNWSASVRREVLLSIGETLGEGGIRRHPHPLAGPIEFSSAPSASVQQDLGDLRVPWSVGASPPAAPAIDFSRWQTYRLYEGGPLHNAVAVGSLLQNTTLRPTADNPLGIFYRGGDVWIRDDVTIQGTLVAAGDVRIEGRDVQLCGFDWRDAQGLPRAADAELWPRLPAVVAQTLFATREARLCVDGAVVVRRGLTGAGAEFDLFSGANVWITGTATAKPVQQPYSVVQLQGTPNLAAVAADGRHAIWLAAGDTGRWHQIVGIDAAAKRLTVVGEAQLDAPTDYRIARSKRQFVDVTGPVLAETVDLYRVEDWVLTSVQWDLHRTNWVLDNVLRALLGQRERSFIEWLAATQDLTLEPTCHLRNSTGLSYRWSPPLFAPYSGSGPDAPLSGYRWKVLTWRESP